MSSRSLFVTAVLLTVAFGLPSIAAAQTPDAEEAAGAGTIDFFEGVRAAGAGGSHTAVASGVDSLYQNPSGLARAPMYVLDGAFTYTPQGLLMTAGIADSKLNPNLAAGVGYSYFIGQGDFSNLSGHDARVGVAIPAVPEQISVGAGVRFLRITDSDIPESEDEEQLLLQGFTVDAGVNFRVADMLHLGLKGENLIDHCADDDRCRGMTPTTITGGVGLGEETGFMFSADVGIDLTSSDDGPLFDFGAGFEYLVGGAVPVRAGFQRREFLDRNMLTFGGGWRSEDVGLDLSYGHDLRQATAFGHASASFSVYF